MIFPNVLSGYLATLLPSQLVKGLEEKSSIEVLVGTILVLVLIMLVCDMLYEVMYEYLYRNSMSLTLYYYKLCFRKMMAVD